MLSYQHAYHAGNAADLHKHAVLAELLARLTVKARGISYVETHAGRGLYDLDAAEALKTGEAARGVEAVLLDPATPYCHAVASVRSEHGARAYPGSPMIARALLRPQDRITLMELHPAEHAALRDSMAGDGVAIHRRDGREGVLALAPFKPRKGLALVDPSYEVKAEYRETAEFAKALIVKWPEAVIVIWYPLLPAGRHREMLAGLDALRLHVDEVTFESAPARGMTGSGLTIINAPHGTRDALLAARRIGNGVFVPRP